MKAAILSALRIGRFYLPEDIYNTVPHQKSDLYKVHRSECMAPLALTFRARLDHRRVASLIEVTFAFHIISCQILG